MVFIFFSIIQYLSYIYIYMLFFHFLIFPCVQLTRGALRIEVVQSSDKMDMDLTPNFIKKKKNRKNYHECVLYTILCYIYCVPIDSEVVRSLFDCHQRQNKTKILRLKSKLNSETMYYTVNITNVNKF